MWFKQSDDFVAHPKTTRAAKVLGGERRRARGRIVAVWSEGGQHAAKYLTGGRITKDALEDFQCDPKPEEVAAALVAAELWHDRGDHYQFHDWQEYNPAADERKAERKDQALTRQLQKSGITDDVQARDTDRCRFCGREVNWKDRRGDVGGTYAFLDLDAGATVDNVVVCCRRCRGRRKDGDPTLELLAPGTAAPADRDPDLLDGPPETVNRITETRVSIVVDQIETQVGPSSGSRSDLVPDLDPTQVRSSADLCSRAGSRARDPGPSRPDLDLQDPEEPRVVRRARPARMGIYELHEVRAQLHAATHGFIEQGPPFVDHQGEPVIGELVAAIGQLAVQ